VQSLDGNKVTDSFRMLFMVASVRARYAPVTGAYTQPVATANILFCVLPVYKMHALEENEYVIKANYDVITNVILRTC